MVFHVKLNHEKSTSTRNNNMKTEDLLYALFACLVNSVITLLLTHHKSLDEAMLTIAAVYSFILLNLLVVAGISRIGDWLETKKYNARKKTRS